MRSARTQTVSAPSDIERFWMCVAPQPSGCWHWTGYILERNGYGLFRPTNGPSRIAHRWGYSVLVGPVPRMLQLDHVCHTLDKSCPGGACLHRRCVNPAHLEPVTNWENSQRSRRKNDDCCKNGHPRTPESTYQTPYGRRKCRVCHALGEDRRRRRLGLPERTKRLIVGKSREEWDEA
jgi:hypothetical protein